MKSRKTYEQCSNRELNQCWPKWGQCALFGGWGRHLLHPEHTPASKAIDIVPLETRPETKKKCGAIPGAPSWRSAAAVERGEGRRRGFRALPRVTVDRGRLPVTQGCKNLHLDCPGLQPRREDAFHQLLRHLVWVPVALLQDVRHRLRLCGGPKRGKGQAMHTPERVASKITGAR